MTVEPRTEAGKRLRGGLRHYSMPLGGEWVPVSEPDAAAMILEIESEARAAALREVAEAVEKGRPRCRVRDQGAGRNDIGICAIHHEIWWNDRCEDFDRGVRDLLDAILTEATGASPDAE
jgi:hypothetical protein